MATHPHIGIWHRPYVLPESFVWPLVDVASLGIEKPQGMLFIKLLEATNVPRMDMFTDSDCFVKCAQLPPWPLPVSYS